MRILFINNDGGGFADYIEVPDASTVEQLFAEQMQGASAQDFLIRVNHRPVAAGNVLQEDDRVSITPLKIEGAVRSVLQRRMRRA